MAKVRAFKKLNLKDRETQKLQDNLEQVFASILGNQLLDSVLIKSVELKTGQANLIEHKLGREPQGWFVIRRRADSRIWDAQDDNTFKKKSLDIRCSADVTIDIFIF